MFTQIAITSLGVISSLGVEHKGLWDSFINPKRIYRPIPEIQYFDLNNHNLCSIDDKQLSLHPKERRIIGKHSTMLMFASEKAYLKGGLRDLQPEDIGFFTSFGMVDYTVEDLLPAVVKSIKDGRLDYSSFFKGAYREIYPLWPLSMLNNIALCQTAIRLGIKGDNAVYTPHSDSSLQAINSACLSVAMGHCKIALAGGVSEVIGPNSLARYLNCNTNKSRVGCNIDDTLITPMAEGSAIFAIERLDDARLRGKRPLALIVGFGSAFGFDDLKGGPSQEAIKRAIERSLINANINSKDIDVVFSHYDSKTEEGINETRALCEIFDKAIKIVSSKAVLGDMLSGAGAFDIALAISMFDTEKVDTALINAFSVEGNTASLIIKRYKE